jgi:hypothetical protein
MSRRLSWLFALLAVVALALGGSVAASAKGKPSSKDRKALFATMLGKNEVGNDGKKGAGDLDGLGSFTAIAAGGKLCFGMTVRGLDTPIAAHIHKASPSVSGPIVVPLTQPSPGDPGAASGCTDIAADVLAAILKNPSKYYVNVHTNAFPGGALRGQLHKR